MSGIDLLAQLRADAQGLRFVADHNRKKGETVYAVRQLDHLAATMEAAADVLAAIDALLLAATAGPPEMAPLLDDLFRILHPEDGAS